MVEFKGLLSKKAADFYYFRKLLFFFMMTLIGIIGTFPFVFLLRLVIGKVAYSIYLAIISLLVSVFLAMLLPVFRDKDVRKGPRLICIAKELLVETEIGKEIRRFDDVTKVKEYRDFYVIYFKRSFNTFEFICQKELLTSGTLEEFESLFEGKIIRKTK